MSSGANDPPPRSPGLRPRRPWVAGLLTLLLAGLGHLYAGRPRRALLFFFLDAIWAALMMQALLRVPTQGPNLHVPVTLYWAFRFLVALDAARTAHAAPAAYAPRRFNRWYLYVACFLLLGWAHLWTVFHAGVGMFYLPTVAMAQTLVPGDTLLVDRLAYGLPLPLTADEAFRYAEPERGHVVVYQITDARGVPQAFVFRVLGVPGDELESRAGQLFVNGAPHDEPYLHLEGSPQEDFGPVTVPGASYFVLGDNRNRSRDSRYADYRFVRRSQILGRVRTVLFSVDPYTGGLRPDRLGAVIR